MDSVVIRPPRRVARLRRLSRRQVLALLAALLVIGLGLVAAIREFAPRLVDTAPPPVDVCGPITGSVTWDSSHTWVIESSCATGVTVPAGATLTLDGGHGPFSVLTHQVTAPAITVNGGTLQTANTSAANTVSFDAEFDAPSWPGLLITSDGASPPHRGVATLAYVNIGSQSNLSSHPTTGIQIDSGATSLSGGFGLILSNVNVFNASGDAIFGKDTAISVTGGTISDAGSVGVHASFTSGPAGSGVTVNGVTINRSGNEAIRAELNLVQPATITGNTVSTAGLNGIHLLDAASPVVTGNAIKCSGHQDAVDCPGAGTRYPAIYFDGGTYDFSQIASNTGLQNGIDAIAMHGTVSSNLTWITPSDSSTTSHPLGYLVDGSLIIKGKTLTVPPGGVVKVGGLLQVNNGTLTAGAGAVLTSLDDNAPMGIPAGTVSQACPSVFFQACPSPLGGSEWSGIGLQGDPNNGKAVAVLNGAAVTHATSAITINNAGVNFGASTYGLTLNGSTIQSSSSDGIFAIDTPVSIDHSSITAIGAHGISASFIGPAPASAGLSVTNSTIQQTGNEGILGTALTGQPITISGNHVTGASAYGVRLESAGLGAGGSLVLKTNVITGSGTGSSPYPAVYLNGTAADFTTSVSGNTGNGNGLDAIVFHGTALGNLSWQTAGVNPSASTPLGYLLDSGLVLNGGTLTVHAGDVVKAARGGQITLNGPSSAVAVDGTDASSTRAKVFTSLKDTSFGIPICPATVLSDCASPAPGDWGGLNLTGGAGATITNGLIRFASTGIAVDHGTGVNLTNTSVVSTSSDGITAQSTPVLVSGGSFSAIGQHAINAAMAGVGAGGTQLGITGVSFTGSGNEAIVATSLGSHITSIVGNTIDQAGTYGINLQSADVLTLQGNVVTRSGAGRGGPYPAIYLNGVAGDFAVAISGNRGASNGLDALAFHGTAFTGLVWKTATQSAALHDLGYLLDGDLVLPSGEPLTVNAGDIVKVETGAIHLNGGTLNANATASAAAKIFTSLSDNSAGVVACPSALLNPCARPPQAGDWGGLVLTQDGLGNHASGAVVNAVIRYASTAIGVTSGATSAPGSSSYGLTVARSRIGPSAEDGISSQDTPVLVTDSTISGAGGLGVAGHGLEIDLLGAQSATGLQVRGVEIANTTGEGILGTHLGGRTVWISDSRVRNPGLSGIQLADADRLVMRNNFICGSGAGPSGSTACGAGVEYPAVWLNGVTADLTRDVRGNLGASNGLDAIVFHGTVTQSLTWIDPVNGTAPHALGYLLDAGLTMNGNLTLTVHNATVKAFGGGITLNGGTLDANAATFTSLEDPAGLNVCASGQSPFLACRSAQKGDWGGITVTNDEAGHAGSATLVGGLVNYATTGVAIDNGAARGLSVQGSEIANASGDGISAQDTAVQILNGNIHNIQSHGVNVSFTGTTSTAGVTITGGTFNQTGKEAILANVISGQPVSITNATISNAGTYGIQLIGAVSPTVYGNTLSFTGSGTTATAFPAIYLNGVTAADFTGTTPLSGIAANTGFTNALEAIAFHGSTGPLTWSTVRVNNTTTTKALGYLLDGALTIAGDFTVPDQSVVRTGGGSGATITVNGNLVADGAGTSRTFTSLLDPINPLTCPSPILKVSGCSPAKGDWGGLVVNGSATLTNATISYDDGLTVNNGSLNYMNGTIHDILGNAIALTNSPSTITGVSFSAIGGKAVITNGAPVAIQCDQVLSGGLAGSNYSVAQSDLLSFYNPTNPVADVTASSGSVVAEHNFWGPPAPAAANPAPPASGQTVGTVDSTHFLATQLPTLDSGLDPSVSATLTDSTLGLNQPTGKPAQPLDPNQVDSSNHLKADGTGLLTLTAVFGRQMDITKDPTVSFALPTQPISVSTASDGWQADKQTWIGRYRLDASVGVLGLTASAVTVSDARACVTSDIMQPKTISFNTDVTSGATVQISLPGDAPTRVGAHSALLHGEITTNGWAITDSSSVFAQFVVTPRLGGPALTFPIIETLAKNSPANTPVSALATGLAPSTDYIYALVVSSPNDVATGGVNSGPAATDLVTTGEASQLVIGTVTPPIVAGTPFPVTITAEDTLANVVADYTGTVTLSVVNPDTLATLPSAPFTTGNGLDNGTHTFSVTLTKAGPQALHANGTGVASPSGSSAGFTVNPGAAASLRVNSFPTPIVAGTPGSVNVTALDLYANTATGYTGTVHLTSSDGQAVVSADAGLVSGVGTFSATLKTAGTQSLTATDTVISSVTGSQSGIVVSPAAAASLMVSGYPASTTAGASHTVTVTALDAYANTATGYAGTVHLTSSDGQAVVSADAGLVSGVGTFSATLKTAGTQSLTATDTVISSVTGSQSGIVVSPAAAASLMVSGYPASTTAGASHTVTVTALDAYANTATGYTGTVHFTSTDINASLPADYTFVALDAGVHSFAPTLKTAGSQSFTVTDTVTASLTATQSGIVVSPATTSQLALSGLSSPTAGVAQSNTVSAEDAFGNVTPSYTGTVHFTSSDSQAALPADYAFVALDAGTHTFGVTLKTAGSQSVTATDTVISSVTGSQSGIVVSPAAANKLAFLQQPTNTTATLAITPAITVGIEDQFGNVVTTDSSTVAMAIATNPSAGTLSGTASLAASSGVATFSGLSIDKAGTGYTLKATDGSLASATSDPFDIAIGSASQLVFTTEPSGSATHATPFAQQPVVSVEDAGGNVVTSDNTTVVTLTISGGDPLGALTCTTIPPQVTNGVATFAGCSISVASVTPYQLVANGTSPTLGPVASANITVS